MPEKKTISFADLFARYNAAFMTVTDACSGDNHVSLGFQADGTVSADEGMRVLESPYDGRSISNLLEPDVTLVDARPSEVNVYYKGGLVGTIFFLYLREATNEQTNLLTGIRDSLIDIESEAPETVADILNDVHRLECTITGAEYIEATKEN